MNKILNETRHPYVIAAKLGIPLNTAREMLTADLDPIPGWGKVNLQKYIIARKYKSSSWSDDHLIATHRQKFDKGEVNICQGRDGDWFILYSIPVKKRVSREPYFARTEYY